MKRFIPIHAAGVTIIGGADGPTAIFVAHRAVPWALAAGAALVLLLAAAGVALYVHHKKQ